MTTRTIRNGSTVQVPIAIGETLKVVAVSGTFTATVTQGTGQGTALATGATGGSYGPYAYASMVSLVSSVQSEIDFDVGVSPVVESDTFARLNIDPLTGMMGVVNPVTGVIYSLGSSAYTWATLPLASASSGVMALVTDVNGGTFFRSNGVRWKPYNNIAALKLLGDRVTMNGATEVILAQLALPAGILQNGDNLRLRMSLSKSAATEIATLRLRLGTLGTVADTTIFSNASLATTAISVGYDLSFKRATSTTIVKTGSGSTLQPFAGASTAAYATAVTVANMDTSDTIFTLTSTLSTGAETIALEDLVIELVSK